MIYSSVEYILQKSNTILNIHAKPSPCYASSPAENSLLLFEQRREPSNIVPACHFLAFAKDGLPLEALAKGGREVLSIITSFQRGLVAFQKKDSFFLQ